MKVKDFLKAFSTEAVVGMYVEGTKRAKEAKLVKTAQAIASYGERIVDSAYPVGDGAIVLFVA